MPALESVLVKATSIKYQKKIRVSPKKYVLSALQNEISVIKQQEKIVKQNLVPSGFAYG